MRGDADRSVCFLGGERVQVAVGVVRVLDVADEVAVGVLPRGHDPRVVHQELVAGAAHEIVPGRVVRHERLARVVLEHVVGLVGAQFEAEDLPDARPVPLAGAAPLDGVADAQLRVVVEEARRHPQKFARVGGTAKSNYLTYYK